MPPGAGVGSAIGFLRAPYAFEATRSVYMRLDAFDAVTVSQLFAALRAEATDFVLSCDATATVLAEHKVYMRYTGQGWEIPVILSAELAEAPEGAAFLALFEAEYATLFGRTVTGLAVEMTVWAVNATTPVAMPALTQAAAATSSGGRPGAAGVFPTLGRVVPAALLDRAAMTDGKTIKGPAIITETETTIIVPAGFSATGRADGCIDIERTP